MAAAVKVCSLAGDDSLDGSSLGQAAGLALQLAVKVLDGVLVPLDGFQVGHCVAQTPHLLGLQKTANKPELLSLLET